ncbi:MAG: hypothetical protein M3290_06285, partial [Actinomycetota bacterium]|nr:hypothetical protein [Actinomycetota bacterium]
MKRPALVLAAAAAIATLLGSACGGSDAGSTADTNRPTASALSDQSYNQALSAAETKVTTAEQAARN